MAEGDLKGLAVEFTERALESIGIGLDADTKNRIRIAINAKVQQKVKDIEEWQDGLDSQPDYERDKDRLQAFIEKCIDDELGHDVLLDSFEEGGAPAPVADPPPAQPSLNETEIRALLENMPPLTEGRTVDEFMTAILPKFGSDQMGVDEVLELYNMYRTAPRSVRQIPRSSRAAPRPIVPSAAAPPPDPAMYPYRGGYESQSAGSDADEALTQAAETLPTPRRNRSRSRSADSGSPSLLDSDSEDEGTASQNLDEL